MLRQDVHPLVLWDAPFLPTSAQGGLPWRAAAKLALPLRRQLVAQLVAGVVFLLEQGFYPDRALLRGSQFTRSPNGVWWRLSGFPQRTLADPRLSRALARGRRAERLPWLLLLPFLAELLPELRGFWGELEDDADPWAFPKLLLEELVRKDKTGKTLDHPLGWGRFLWARRFALPEEGAAFYLDEPYLAARLAQWAGVTAGDLSEETLAKHQARALVDGEWGLVITTSALPGVNALPLAEAEPVWCLLPLGGEERAASFLAGASGGDSIAAALALRRAVSAGWGWGEAPHTARHRYLSYPAQKLLAVLERSGLGLTSQEAAVVAGGSEALEELRRFQLVLQRFARWFAGQSEQVAPDILAPWRERLPEGPLSWALAAAVGGPAAKLRAWCEEVLDQGRGELILGLSPLVALVAELRVPFVEAALATGWLSYALPWLQACPPPRASLFRVWWAVASGNKKTLQHALDVLLALPEDELPLRLRAKRRLLAATLAQWHGDHQRARELGRTVFELPGLDTDLLVEAAYWVGDDALEKLLRSHPLGPHQRQRLYHLLGVQAMQRGDAVVAEKRFRQALQRGSARNPLRFGELLADAGAVAMLLDQALQAEKFFAAAEFWLSLAGSRRATRLVSFNRAVLANDRLQWQKAQKLLAAAAGDEAETTALDEAFFLVESARSFLAQGHWQKAKEIAEKLEKLVKNFPENHNIRQGVAVVQAHLALARCDFPEAQKATQEAEASERRLLLALLESREGLSPSDDLPNRWGLALTARLLALARTAPLRAVALAREALLTGGAQNALGVARALLLAPAWGVELVSHAKGLCPKVKQQLRDAGLDGWVLQLEAQFGRDWVEILERVATLGERGAATWQAPEWDHLARVLGLLGLSISCQGQELLRWGFLREAQRLKLGPFAVEVAGPVDNEVLAVLRLVLQKVAIPVGAPAASDDLGLTGTSPQVVALRADIMRYGPHPLTVLILGEPGTGKERVARALHRVSGRGGEFVAVNCAGLPESLLEAELFGVVRGAFTGADRDRPGLVEQAEGGTLFLDEVGELPASVQAKLLRVLQEKEVRRVGGTRTRKVDVRFVAATNRDLKQAVASGQFRRDLFDRLAMATLRVPPLRERPSDIPALLSELVTQYASLFGLGPASWEPEFVARLQAYSWPGNVRELESVVVQALLRCPRGAALAPEHLPQELGPPVGIEGEGPMVPLAVAERAFYRDYFLRLLRKTHGNRSRAAKLAGLSRQALIYRLRQLGLSRGEDDD